MADTISVIVVVKENIRNIFPFILLAFFASVNIGSGRPVMHDRPHAMCVRETVLIEGRLEFMLGGRLQEYDHCGG